MSNYIVSHEPTPMDSEHTQVYTFVNAVGDPEGLTAVRRTLVSLLAGAAATGVVNNEAAFWFFQELADGDGILERDRIIFEGIMSQADDYAPILDRQIQIFRALTSGTMAVDAALDEASLLARQELRSDGIIAINDQGLKGRFTEDGFELAITPVGTDEISDVIYEYLGDSDAAAEVVANSGLPINAFARQYEYLPADWVARSRPTVASDRDHLTFGNMAEDGTFEPLITVLNPQHPERLNITDTTRVLGVM